MTYGGMDAVRATLGIALDAAVPLLILDLGQLAPDQRDDVRMRWARESADTIASKGDTQMFRTKTKGETAATFNALARGLAAGAYQPGGITFLDRHWEAAPTDPAARVAKPARPVETLSPGGGSL